MELSHHILQTAHLVENARIDDTRDLLLHVAHLGWVDVGWHFSATVEQAFGSAHLFDYLSKLGVLRDEILDFFGRDASASSHSVISARRLGEYFGAIWRVKLYLVFKKDP